MEQDKPQGRHAYVDFGKILRNLGTKKPFPPQSSPIPTGSKAPTVCPKPQLVGEPRIGNPSTKQYDYNLKAYVGGCETLPAKPSHLLPYMPKEVKDYIQLLESVIGMV